MVSEPAARFCVLEFLESEMIWLRNTMSSKSRHVRRYVDTAVYTKPRNLGRMALILGVKENSLRHGETIDILPVA